MLKSIMLKLLAVAVGLTALAATGLGQEAGQTAEEEFVRGFTQVPTPKKTSKPPRTVKTPKPVSLATTVGKSGMKVWLERQIACDENKPFVRVAPTTVFRSGDCVRLQFRLNFAGYLKIINLGTSGNERTIFPTTLVPPKTSNTLPDNRGWKFDDNPGAEQLVFIVSKSPVGVSNVDDSVGSRDLIRNDSPDVEVYDKDLLPRVENEQVYVLSDATRLGKPIVFRLTLKHR